MSGPYGRRSLAVLVTCAALAFSASTVPPAQAAEGVIHNAGTPAAVADSYIVVLKNSESVRSKGVPTRARDLASKHSGSVSHVYQKALRGFSVKMNEGQAKKLAADPDVEYVEQDSLMHISETQNNPPSWGLDRVDQRNLPLSASYTYSTTAANVTAYVIDTGVNLTHTTFGGRATSGRDFVQNDNDASDGNGHGTHVAGTIAGSQYGLAKAARIVGVRVLDNSGSGTTSGVIAGVDWVTANAVKPAVANMSLGGGASTTLDNAVNNSINSGVTYALAAGNESTNACNGSPGRTPAAITVGSTTQTDARSSFSNFGTCVDIFAPGSSITSSWIGSTTATNTISGTSMATPHVAGAAALILAGNPGFTPAQVRSAMVTAGTTGVVTNPGTGSPNVLLFTGSGGTTPPSGCAAVSNGTDVAIPDVGSAVTSSITISGCTGNASAGTTAEVHIRHTYRGDLVIDLLAPDGTAYRLKNSSSTDSADNVDVIYTVNASSEVANGVWRLRVQDVFAADTGTIDTWTLHP